MDKLHFKSAVEIARLIRERKVRAIEALEHFLARVEKYNPKLNAVIWLDVGRVSYSGQVMPALCICRRRWAQPASLSRGCRSATRPSPPAVGTIPRPPLAASSKRKSSALFRRPASTDRCPIGD